MKQQKKQASVCFFFRKDDADPQKERGSVRNPCEGARSVLKSIIKERSAVLSYFYSKSKRRGVYELSQ